MNARGFTLVEWLIAMVIGIFLLGGVLSVFVASRATTEDVFDQSELQENGRLAMRLVTQDLRWAGFWGDYTGMPMQRDVGVSLSTGAVVSTTSDCIDERGEGSLPSAATVTRALWVGRVDASKSMSGFSCITAASRIANSDVISIKRLIGQPLVSGFDTNRFYMATTTQAAYIFRGNEAAPTEAAMPTRQIWEYQHYIYYLALGTTGIPELRKRILTANGGSFLITGPMAEGIEYIVVLYGVDTTLVQDGQIDKYVGTTNVSAQEWNEGRVISARIFILVRSLQASRKYKNNNTYQVGNVSVSGGNDGFRRLLLESSVAIRNPAVIAGGGK
ncbi:PilW family protein [Aeromonas piscicola]|jgi:type IV pilus assembly protein PilW